MSSLEEGTNLNKILGKSNDINIGNSHLIVIYFYCVDENSVTLEFVQNQCVDFIDN